MRRYLIGFVIALQLLITGCAMTTQTPPTPKPTVETPVPTPAEPAPKLTPTEQITALLQKGDVDGLLALVGAEGLKVAPYATDGFEVLKGDQLKAALQAMLKGAKVEVVASHGSGNTLRMAVKGLNQVDLVGGHRSTELVELTFLFSAPAKMEWAALVTDPLGLFAASIKDGYQTQQ